MIKDKILNGITELDDSNLYFKNELLARYRRMVMIWTDGVNTIEIKEPDNYITVDLYKFRETWSEKNYKLRFLEASKNLCIFKADATAGDKAVIFFEYSGFVMV